MLRNARIECIVHPAHIDESRLNGEPALEFAKRLAKEKADAVFVACNRHEIVLGADTVVVVDAEVLGKPADVDDARRMLRMLSGRPHEVITGVALVGDGFAEVAAETTKVYFDTLTEADIEEYVATGEPMDKAGAYAIQGVASRWIGRIEGDYFNVVGLPVALVNKMLRARLEEGSAEAV